MIYNEFNGDRLSRLGFGCMRFTCDPETGVIDQEKVNAMFDLAIKNGVNYFDTAYPYLGGNSEIAMAEALKKYPRESYYIADKFPGHSLTGPIDNIALFERSLEKCGIDYFDYYLLHNVNETSLKIYESDEYHIIPDMIKMKEAGKIRHLGFSCHSGPEMLEDFLTRHEGLFEFVQIQCNYLDWTMQDAKEKYEIIKKHGLGMWVMEPVRGGKLANLPEAAHEKLAAFGSASDASYAFRFLQDLDNIKMVLSGMNEISQVEDNLNTFNEHKALTEAETNALLDIAETLKQGAPCTRCRYCCAGCPQELDIPFLLECYNDLKLADGMTSRIRMDGLTEDKRPSACIGCGQCAEACPQKIAVPNVLAELADMYSKGPKWCEIAKSRHAAMVHDLEESR